MNGNLAMALRGAAVLLFAVLITLVLYWMGWINLSGHCYPAGWPVC